MDDDGSRKASKSSAAAIVAVLLLLPLSYVLSVGPACRMCEQELITHQRLVQVYAPIVWVEEQSAVLHDAIEWYIGLWLSG